VKQRRPISFITLASAIFILVSTTSSSGQSAHRQIAAGMTEASPADFTRLPLAFELNRGQTDLAVNYLAHGQAYTVFLKPTEASVLLPNGGGHAAVRLRFVGGNPTTHSVGLERLPGKTNYYIGKDSTRWLTNLPNYARVQFKEVYPGIDVVYYGKQGELEYDLALAPGADSEKIQLQVEGAEDIQIDHNGDLSITAGSGAVHFRKPIIYQEGKTGKQVIAGGFVPLSKDTIGFAIGAHDNQLPLVVDPVLSYSSVIDVNNTTQPQGITADSEGNAYITGYTSATNYPTVNAFQSANDGSQNVFITKFGPSGNVILYSTYLGGSNVDSGQGIAVDNSGAAYVTGFTTSSNFPTTPGAFMTSCPEFFACPFVTKVLTDGSLAFSTLTAGSGIVGYGIAVNGAGNAYITGLTSSNELPIVNAFEPNFPGQTCTSCFSGFVQELSADGSALVYSTYFGGAGYGDAPATSGSGIAVDSVGSAVIVGGTTAIPTQNPIQASVAGSVTVPNAFVAKFTPDGRALVFSTYIGGSGYYEDGIADVATGVAVDGAGNIHVVGNSPSCDFPLTLQAFSTTCVNTSYDNKVFALVLNSTGSQLLFSTFLGSGSASGVAVDSSGDTFVGGSTSSQTFPTLEPVEGSSQATAETGVFNTGFVSELNLSGDLVSSTYFGGEGGGSVAVAAGTEGKMFLTGTAGAFDFPILNPIPGQVCCSNSIFIAKILSGKGPQLSLSPRYSPLLTLRNVSSTTLDIQSIIASKNFTKGGDCGTVLAPGTGCTLILEGADDNKTSGTVTITSNDRAGTQKFIIAKSPTGDNVGPVVRSTPAALTFAPQLIGTKSKVQHVTLTNVGLQPSQIATISTSGDFSQTNNCPTTLNPHSSCSISVTYSPTSPGPSSAQLTISHDENQYTVELQGTGSQSAIMLSTPDMYMSFATQFVGIPGPTRVLNVMNTTPYPATITSVSTTKGFTERDTCGTPIPAFGSCRVALTFKPTTNENASGTVTVSNNGPGGPQTENLRATGLISSDLSVSPFLLNFGNVIIGSQGSQMVTLTNVGQQSINIDTFKLSSSLFTQTNNCPPTLDPAASCQVTVVFTPGKEGVRSGTLQVFHSGQGSPQVVGLTGTCIAALLLTPNPVVFGDQQVGTSSPENSLGLDNPSSRNSITIESVQLQGKDFSIAQNICITTLPPYYGCDVEFVFTPTATGLRTGTVKVFASDRSNPHIAKLEGRGVGYGVTSLSPDSLDFGLQRVGTKSKAQQVTLTNTGSGSLNISSIVASPTFFTERNNCPAMLEPSNGCQIGVRFAPTMAGMVIGNLTVTDDAAGSPHTVSLAGIGR